MSLRATLRGGQLENQQCVIRDFCPGGLFLSWPDESLQNQDDKCIGQVFSVEFKVKVKQGDILQSAIEIKVITKYNGGLGVAFVNPDKEALMLLHKIAQISQAKVKAQTEAASKKLKESQASDASSVEKSSNDKSSLLTSLSTILIAYLKQVDLAFITETKEISDEKDKFDYFNASELLKGKIDNANDAILRAIQGQLTHQSSLAWEKTVDEAVSSNSLSLVDEQEFESYLILNGVISDAEANNRILLYRVTKRLSTVYSSQFDQSTSPIGVSRLCRTIDDYFQHLGFEHKALGLSYKQMNVALIPELIRFYEAFAGDEPLESTPDKNAFKQESVHPRPYPIPGQMPQANDQQYPVGSAWQHTQYGQANHERPVVTSPHGSHHNGHPYPQSGQSAGVYGQDIAQSLMALQESISASAKSPSYYSSNTGSVGQFPQLDSGFGGQGGGLERTVNGQELFQLLNNLQREDQQNLESEETIFDMQNRIGSLLQSQNLRLTPKHQQSVNLAGNMLNYFQQDEQLTGIGRQDLQRLQSLLFKQAVSEEGLTRRTANPLRSIINTLDQLDRHGANESEQLRPAINDLMKKVLSMDELPAHVLENVNQQFDQLLESQKQTHQEKLVEIAKECDLEETFIADHRRKDQIDNSASGQQLLSNPEWMIWQKKAESILQGESLLVDRGNGEKERLTLAWKAKDGNDFVFADSDGQKAAKMTLRELAVRMLKGSAELEQTRDHSLFDQAVVSGLFNAYDEVKQTLEIDQELGIWKEDRFYSNLADLLENAKSDMVEHGLIYIETDVENIVDELKLDYLKHVSTAIKNTLEDDQPLAMMGETGMSISWEFANLEGSLILSEMILKSLEDAPFVMNEVNHPIHVSMGINFIRSESATVDEIIEQVKRAAEQSKSQGENQATFYESDDPEASASHSTFDWELWLEDYSEEGEIPPLYHQTYQAKAAQDSKPLMHLFVAREESDKNLATPDRYLKKCKDAKRIIAYEKNYFTAAMTWLSDNRKTLRSVSGCILNLSNDSINHKSMLDYVLEEFNSSNVIPGKVCFSIPTSALNKENKNALRFVRTLKEFGCRFCLGDFGQDDTGHDAMKLPVQYVGIDTSLVKKLADDEIVLGLVKSINDIAHMMDKQSIIPMLISEEVCETLSPISFDYLSTNNVGDLTQIQQEVIEVSA